MPDSPSTCQLENAVFQGFLNVREYVITPRKRSVRPKGLSPITEMLRCAQRDIPLVFWRKWFTKHLEEARFLGCVTGIRLPRTPKIGNSPNFREVLIFYCEASCYNDLTIQERNDEKTLYW
jgi:hypothetical protein